MQAGVSLRRRTSGQNSQYAFSRAIERTCWDGARACGNGDEQALPVRQEDDRLDQRKLEQRLEGCQQLVGAQVEEQQAIERDRVGQVVEDGDP